MKIERAHIPNVMKRPIYKLQMSVGIDESIAILCNGSLLSHGRDYIFSVSLGKIEFLEPVRRDIRYQYGMSIEISRSEAKEYQKPASDKKKTREAFRRGNFTRVKNKTLAAIKLFGYNVNPGQIIEVSKSDARSSSLIKLISDGMLQPLYGIQEESVGKDELLNSIEYALQSQPKKYEKEVDDQKTIQKLIKKLEKIGDGDVQTGLDRATGMVKEQKKKKQKSDIKKALGKRKLL